MSHGRPAVQAANSSKTAALSRQAKSSPKPSSRASPATISQSGLASPGGAIARRTRPMRRSELVIAPSFSGHAAAGRTACASEDVSVGWCGSCTTTSSARSSAARARWASGSDTSGFVAMIQTAFTRPSCERVEERDGRQAGRRRDPPGGNPPVLLHRGAVVGVGDLAVAGQQLRQAAGLAAAHRVGLAGERQRPAARAPDLPGREAEVDQRAVLQRADRRLVGAHRPQRHRRARAREAARRLLDELRRHLADVGGALGRPLAGDRSRLLPAARVARDERLVDEAVAIDDVQQRAQQREVGARAAPAGADPSRARSASRAGRRR